MEIPPFVLDLANFGDYSTTLVKLVVTIAIINNTIVAVDATIAVLDATIVAVEATIVAMEATIMMDFTRIVVLLLEVGLTSPPPALLQPPSKP